MKSGPVEITKKDGVKALVQKKNLEGKIRGLHDPGVLTKKHADLLHELRFLGNEAVHELDQPSTNENNGVEQRVESAGAIVRQVPPPGGRTFMEEGQGGAVVGASATTV